MDNAVQKGDRIAITEIKGRVTSKAIFLRESVRTKKFADKFHKKTVIWSLISQTPSPPAPLERHT